MGKVCLLQSSLCTLYILFIVINTCFRFNFDKFVPHRSHNVRLGLFPRIVGDSTVTPDWYDIGIPGFVWHCVGARQEGNLVTCWMPIFEDDYSEIPIHLAKEGHSFLYKIVIDTNTKSVVEVKSFKDIGPTERCAVNDSVRMYGLYNYLFDYYLT